MKLIGLNVKSARLKANFTQECLAELAGIHWQTVSYAEMGKHPLLITTFVRISQALDVSPNRLLDGIPEPDRVRMEKIKKTMVRKRAAKAL